MSLSDPPAFDTQRTRELLQSALDFKKDAGATHTPTSRSFLPSRHFRALNPDYPLVLGGRGAGKTHWARALTSPGDLAVVLQAHQEQGVRMEGAVVSFFQRAQVHIGYDENSRAGELPSREEFHRLLGKKYTAANIWKAIVAFRVWQGDDAATFTALSDWESRVSWITRNALETEQRFSRCNQIFADAPRLVVFDAIDTTGEDWAELTQITKGLLECLLYFRGFVGIRLKAFLRPDTLEPPEVWSFRDSSKLRQDTFELTWKTNELYALVWHVLANHEESGSFRDETTSLPLHEHIDAFRNRREDRICWEQYAGTWVLPNRLRNVESVQELVLHCITGPRIFRTTPYKWLIAMLQDSRAQVSPRSFLTAFHKAAEHAAPEDDHGYALPQKALAAGVQQAALHRTTELAEDHVWIGIALGALNGLAVPAYWDQVLHAWAEAKVVARIRKQCSGQRKLLPRSLGLDLGSLSEERQLEGLRNELMGLGIFFIRNDGRIDLPEVIRIGYGLRRRGAVRPPARKPF